MNSDRYVNDILIPFFKQLTTEERQYGYLQQDNATAHTSNAIQEVFEGNNQQGTVGIPRSQFLQFLSLGKTEEKSVQEQSSRH
jgi:hypothetical protein